MAGPVHSSPESLKFQTVGEVQIVRKGGETTATQKITYNGREYEVEIKLGGTGHSDTDMNTHMQEALGKTKLFAKSLGLGTEVSAFSFKGDRDFSANNMQGGQMTNEQLKAKLEEAKTKYEEKKTLFQETGNTKRRGKLTPGSGEFQSKAEKLERKIQTLSQLTAILGKQSREDDVEIQIRPTHSSSSTPPLPDLPTAPVPESSPKVNNEPGLVQFGLQLDGTANQELLKKQDIEKFENKAMQLVSQIKKWEGSEMTKAELEVFKKEFNEITENVLKEKDHDQFIGKASLLQAIAIQSSNHKELQDFLDEKKGGIKDLIQVRQEQHLKAG